MNVLVTGAGGLLGNRVVDVLRTVGHNAIPMRGVAECDLSDASGLAQFAQHLSFGAIIHAAALTRVDLCDSAPEHAYKANVIGTRNVARLARDRNARLVYVSTASVFSGKTGNYREDDIPEPQNYYSWTKLLGEEAVLGTCDGICVRATVMGVHPSQRTPRNFLEWLVAQLAANADMNVFTDIRVNPLSDGTLAEILVKVLDGADSGSLLHVGTREPWSKADIARWFQQQLFPTYTGRMRDAESSAIPDVAPRSREMWLNVDRIASLVPMPGIESELARLASEFRSRTEK